jgi:hypothetical protein
MLEESKILSKGLHQWWWSDYGVPFSCLELSEKDAHHEHDNRHGVVDENGRSISANTCFNPVGTVTDELDCVGNAHAEQDICGT